jgi:hypothetical protein
LRSAADTASEATERNNSLVIQDGVKVRIRLGEFHAYGNCLSNRVWCKTEKQTIDRCCDLTHVLEMSAEVLASGKGCCKSNPSTWQYQYDRDVTHFFPGWSQVLLTSTELANNTCFQ